MTFSAGAHALRLQPVTLKERTRLEVMFQYYLYDMAEFTGARLSSGGRYNYSFEQIDPYWQNPDYTPYFAYVANELVGFALVRPHPEEAEVTQVWDIEQFFILRHHRRNGLGQALFQACLERHAGQWQIRVMLENTRAWQFWTSAVKALNPSQYEESQMAEDGQKMNLIRFMNPFSGTTTKIGEQQ